MVLPGQFNTIFIGFRVKQPWVSLEVQPFGKKNYAWGEKEVQYKHFPT